MAQEGSVRWPPPTDAKELNTSISKAVEDGSIFGSFYESPKHGQPTLCQGDIILPKSLEIALIDEEGEIIAAEVPNIYRWMLLGNTCDFTREISKNPWTQIVPIIKQEETNKENSQKALDEFRGYKPFKSFYLPPWPGSEPSGIYKADLTMPVTIHKNALREQLPEARMTQKAWYLFSCVLLRYFVRGDGRNDPT
ncbi:hypothetical protein L6R29_23045 [Myxococcota bacterium]|nr:hypothetical protein [Myxococcota bacterium]